MKVSLQNMPPAIREQYIALMSPALCKKFGIAKELTSAERSAQAGKTMRTNLRKMGLKPMK